MHTNDVVCTLWRPFIKCVHTSRKGSRWYRQKCWQAIRPLEPGDAAAPPPPRKNQGVLVSTSSQTIFPRALQDIVTVHVCISLSLSLWKRSYSPVYIQRGLLSCLAPLMFDGCYDFAIIIFWQLTQETSAWSETTSAFPLYCQYTTDYTQVA